MGKINYFYLFISFRPQLKAFNPPYITHKPDIKISELTKDHKYIVLGTDGLCIIYLFIINYIGDELH